MLLLKTWSCKYTNLQKLASLIGLGGVHIAGFPLYENRSFDRFIVKIVLKNPNSDAEFHPARVRPTRIMLFENRL
jgi:hypothetical protein